MTSASIGRATQGVRLIEMEEGDMVVAVAKLAEKYDEGETEAPASDIPPTETPETPSES